MLPSPSFLALISIYTWLMGSAEPKSQPIVTERVGHMLTKFLPSKLSSNPFPVKSGRLVAGLCGSSGLEGETKAQGPPCRGDLDPAGLESPAGATVETSRSQATGT